MTNTALLEEKIKQSGYKRSYIAAKLGRTPYGLALKISGQNEFTATEINTLCNLLGINVEDRMRIFFADSVD